MTLRPLHEPLEVDQRGIARYGNTIWMTLRAACAHLHLPFWRIATTVLKRTFPRTGILRSGKRTRVYDVAHLQRIYKPSVRILSHQAGCEFLVLLLPPPRGSNVIQPSTVHVRRSAEPATFFHLVHDSQPQDMLLTPKRPNLYLVSS